MSHVLVNVNIRWGIYKKVRAISDNLLTIT